MKREMVFNLVKPGEKLETLRQEIVLEFGFNKDIPVVATANDKAVEALGSGIKDEGTV